jgi:hypothetical protein
MREESPEWDQDVADSMVGTYRFVGMTYLAADGESVTSQVQYHGRLVKEDRQAGFEIECEGVCAGKTVILPPLLENIFPAGAGRYELQSTGEIVTDPDLTASWTITQTA